MHRTKYCNNKTRIQTDCHGALQMLIVFSNLLAQIVPYKPLLVVSNNKLPS